MDNEKKSINNSDEKIKKDHKSSKDSLVKEILHDEFEDAPDINEVQYGRDTTNEEDHVKKRHVKKGFCDQNKCDIYFE